MLHPTRFLLNQSRNLVGVNFKVDHPELTQSKYSEVTKNRDLP